MITALPELMHQLFDFAIAHKAILKWLSLGSLLTFCATPLLVIGIILRLPADYFANSERHPRALLFRTPPWYYLFKIFKNLVGIFFILTGLVLLFLPGQGILTILIGVVLTDFPRKYQLERYLIGRPGVHASLNRLRQRFKQPPLLI